MSSETKAREGLWPLIALVCLVLGQTVGSAGAQEASDPSGWDDARMEEFLLNAESGVERQISVGRNMTRRITMNDGVAEHDAHFQIVNESSPREELDSGPVLNFIDTYKGNIAAYRLDRLLDLRMVPVSVERRIGRDTGALTWWVDDVQMMMVDFIDGDLEPPNVALFNHYVYHVRLFNELIYNFDANLQNLLVTDDWRLVIIDLTRAFKIDETLRQPENIEGIRIDRHVYYALQELDYDTLAETMGDLLTDRQIRALLKRRDLIIESLNEQIERRGEALVIRG